MIPLSNSHNSLRSTKLKIIWFLITLQQKNLFWTDFWGERLSNVLDNSVDVLSSLWRHKKLCQEKNVLVAHDPDLWLQFLLIIIYSIHHTDSEYSLQCFILTWYLDISTNICPPVISDLHHGKQPTLTAIYIFELEILNKLDWNWKNYRTSNPQLEILIIT